MEGDSRTTKTTDSRTKKRGAKFCPRWDLQKHLLGPRPATTWSIWECRNCGYHGAFIVEDGKMATKIQEEYTKKHSERKADTQKRPAEA